MNSEQKAVKYFHEAFKLLVNDKPTMIDCETYNLRYELIREELDEFWEACAETKEGNLIGVADALGDLLYVVYGTAISFGIDMEPVFEEIHRSNMEKTGGRKREDGKWMKPDGWKPPDIKKIIGEQL